MSLTLSLSRLLHSLEAHVHALKEEGVRSVEWEGRYESSSDAPVSRAPAAPPAAGSARPSPSPAPSRPAAAPSPPPASPARFSFLTARRIPDDDTLSREESTLGILCETSELKDENRILLENMLAAIGYRFNDDTQTIATAADVPETTRQTLCFGDAAQQLLSPMKMALNLVRGKWQRGPHGKIMALFPPSYLHNNPGGKKATWTDLQRVLQELGLSLPPRKQN